MNSDCIENRLVEFLRTLSGDAALQVDTELLESGIVDSLSMMDILVFIETQFQAQLDSADLNARTFQTPASLAKLIRQRLPTEVLAPRSCSYQLQVAAE